MKNVEYDLQAIDYFVAHAPRNDWASKRLFERHCEKIARFSWQSLKVIGASNDSTLHFYF